MACLTLLLCSFTLKSAHMLWAPHYPRWAGIMFLQQHHGNFIFHGYGETGRSQAQEPHLTLIYLPNAHVQCLQAHARTRVGNDLLLTVLMERAPHCAEWTCQGLKPPSWQTIVFSPLSLLFWKFHPAMFISPPLLICSQTFFFFSFILLIWSPQERQQPFTLEKVYFK